MVENAKNIICFYHEYEDYGCFSNWYQSKFEYAGVKFNSVEQYMMYHKMRQFRKVELCDKILKSDDPAEIKKLGRTRISNFDGELWDRISYTTVKRGMRAKFMQNSDILHVLLDTENKLLAEASPRDKKWSIGISTSNPNCYDVSKWTGDNLLGRILMEVRDKLRYAQAVGALEYIDAKDVDFPEWHMRPCELLRIPKYRHAVHAFLDTLHNPHGEEAFLYYGGLREWEESMRYNMGGGLPAIGFWEMKQDLYDVARITMCAVSK